MSTETNAYHSGPYKNLYAQGVKRGNTIYLAGQVGVGPDGKAGKDIVEQTRIAYENVKHVLAQFSATMDDIVEETWFVTDMKNCMGESEKVFGARAEFLGHKPAVAQTLVEVNALVMPALLLEIKCVAQLP